jgi:hypothetical protein
MGRRGGERGGAWAGGVGGRVGYGQEGWGMGRRERRPWRVGQEREGHQTGGKGTQGRAESLKLALPILKW